MKTEIYNCNLQEQDSTEGLWWKWIETCDRCGTVIQDHKTTCSEEPDPSEVDLCYECLSYLIKNKIKDWKPKED